MFCQRGIALCKIGPRLAVYPPKCSLIFCCIPVTADCRRLPLGCCVTWHDMAWHFARSDLRCKGRNGKCHVESNGHDRLQIVLEYRCSLTKFLVPFPFCTVHVQHPWSFYVFFVSLNKLVCWNRSDAGVHKSGELVPALRTVHVNHPEARRIGDWLRHQTGTTSTSCKSWFVFAKSGSHRPIDLLVIVDACVCSLYILYIMKCNTYRSCQRTWVLQSRLSIFSQAAAIAVAPPQRHKSITNPHLRCLRKVAAKDS